MKLPGISLVLLCCLYSAVYASASSSDSISFSNDTSASSGISDSSSEPAIPPAAASPAVLWDNRTWKTFAPEIALEMAAILGTSAAYATNIGCSSPKLLSVALLLISILYVLKAAFVVLRSESICESTSAAAGPLRFTLTRQVGISSTIVITDLCRAAALLYIEILQHYCAIGAPTTAASTSETLLAAMLVGFIQLTLSYITMLIWGHDMTDPLPAEA